MSERPSIALVAEVMDRIRRAWREGDPRELAPFFHPEVVMAFPGFSGQARGRDTLVGSYVDFCEHSVVHEFHEHDRHIDVVGDTAVVHSAFTMVYEREGRKTHSTGRDLWVLSRHDGQWLAVWRTILDMKERTA